MRSIFPAAATALTLAVTANLAHAAASGTARPCAVVAAQLATSNAFGMVGFRELTQEVQKGLVLALDREDNIYFPLFVEDKEASLQPPKPTASIQKTRCRMLIDVQGILDDKLDMRFDLAVWPAEIDTAGSVVLGRQPSFKKSYAPPHDPEVVKSLDFKTIGDSMFKDLAAAGLLAPIHGAAIDPARVRAEYDRIVAQMAAEPEVHVRHLLVNTETEARAALKRIREGTPFADVARQVTMDPGSRDQGGDLGWSVASNFPEEFARAVNAAGSQTGLLNDLVRTKFGWHVVELLGRQPQKAPAFEQVQRKLVLKLRWQDIEAATARSGGF